MPLLLVDLDNTLIDRAGAFGRWAREFAASLGGGAADVRWLVAGLIARRQFGISAAL